MRRASLLLLSVAVLLPLSASVVSACGGEEPPPVSPQPTTTPPPLPPPPTEPKPEPPPAPKKSLVEMQQENLEMALKGLNGHDPKMFASVYADNGVINVAGLNEVSGREAITQNMAEWFETFKDIKLGFSRVWVKGDTMILEWVINGKHTGELFGVKGKEQPIGHYGLSVVTFNQDGKVVRENRYGELGAVMTQIGAAGTKAKPRPIPEVPKQPEPFGAKGTPEEDKQLEVAKKLLTSLEEKKEADFTGLLTDDMEHDGLFHLETSKGKDGAKKFFKQFTTAFPDAKFEVTKAVAIGDYVIAESTLKATHKGQLGTIAPTKRPVTLHLVDILKMKDGKIARAWTYQNSLELQHQLGLFDVKAGNIPASQAQPAGAAKPGDAAKPTEPKKPEPKKEGGEIKK
jgi:predicted ester cyclase